MHLNSTINYLSAIGLIVDIAGVLILFEYGLPSKVKTVTQFFVTGNETKEEIEEANKHNRNIKRWAYIGLICLLIGFVLQLMGTLFTNSPDVSPKTTTTNPTAKHPTC
jgi:hypothetical protein